MSEGKRRMPWRELGCAFVLIVILAVVLLPILARPQNGGHYRPSCQNHFKMLDFIFKMYSNEMPGGFYPPMFVADVPLYDCTDANLDFVLSVQQGRATPSSEAHGLSISAPLVTAIYPEYLSDPNVLICPSDAGYNEEDFITADGTSFFTVNCVEPRLGAKSAGNSYAYTGFAYYGGDAPVKEPMQLAAVLGGISGAVERGDWAAATKLATEDFAVPSALVADTVSEAKIPRLREGIERFFISDLNDPNAAAKAQSEIWVMHDTVHSDAQSYNHLPGGSNVLFLDGHVEFIRYEPEGERLPPINEASVVAYALLGNLGQAKE